MRQPAVLTVFCIGLLVVAACQATRPSAVQKPSIRTASQSAATAGIDPSATPGSTATAHELTPTAPEAGSTATAALVAASEVLLADPFVDNTEGWSVTNTDLATVDVQAGQLTLNVTQAGAGTAGTHFTRPAVALPPDVELQFEAQPIDGVGGWYGAACRQGPAGMYLFLVSKAGTFAVAGFSQVQQAWQVLALGNAGPHLNAGARSDQLRIVCAGDRLMLEVNGERLADVQDDTYRSGGAALAAESVDGAPISVGFKQFLASAPRQADYAEPVQPLDQIVAFETNKTGGWTILQFKDPAIWQVAADHEGNAGSPAWSPDGRELALSADGTGNQEVYVVEIASGEMRQLTDNPASDFAPAWSPDGEMLAFVSDRGGQYQIYTLPVAGGEPTALTHGTQIDYRHPAWSPDGQQLAYTSFRGGACDVYLINLDTKKQSQLTRNPASGTHDGCRAAWSPDGRQIAYVSARDGNLEIYVVAVDTGAQVRLTHHPGIDSYPAWTSDGTRLVFVSDRAAPEVSTDLYLMNADGSGYVRLTDAHAIVSYPALAP